MSTDRPMGSAAHRELKIHVTVMTDMPESEVRAHANHFAAALAEAVGSRPVKANVTPIGKAQR